jgi:hypothetical protein
MPGKLDPEEMAAKATFIFRGTVQKVGAATMESVPVNDRTAIVRVDQIIQAPEPFSEYAGRDITVQLSGQGKVKEGQQLIFYTNGWLYGDSIAVQSLGQEPVGGGPDASGATAMAMAPGDPVKKHQDQVMKSQVDSADLIVSGTVTNVRVPAAQAGGGGIMTGSGSGTEAAANQPPDIPKSEHDPMWREAVINIASKEKGDHNDQQVVVLFPSSEDVAWHRAPKFTPGQQGVFFLHKKQLTGNLAVPGGQVGDVYTALHSADFQSIDRLGDVQAMAGH